MQLYRPRDYRSIERSLPEITQKAEDRAAEVVEPTLDECKRVQEIVFRFVKDRKRILYGGWAYHLLLRKRGHVEGIYRDDQCKDIEFYSPTPQNDAIDLCRELELHFPQKHTMAREAIHEGTLSIFVNFRQCCDITFLPSGIQGRMQWETTREGFVLPKIEWILVDILRQFTDPLLSYWRLPDKTFARARRLLEGQSLCLPVGKGTRSTWHDIDPAVVSWLPLLAEKFRSAPDRYLFLGPLAEAFYLHPDAPTLPLASPLVLVTDSLAATKDEILGWFSELLPNDPPAISIHEYHPFFQFWDRRVEFCVRETPFLILRGTYNRCDPFQDVTIGGKSWRIGLFPVVFNDQLIRSFTYRACSSASGVYRCHRRLRALLQARKMYLERKRITVMDSSPFQEFRVECRGAVSAPRRLAILRQMRPGRKKFEFVPARTKKDMTLDPYPFDNISGNPVQTAAQRIFPSAWVPGPADVAPDPVKSGPGVAASRDD